MFTKQYIRNLRDMVKKSLDSNEVYVSEIALDEIERLQAERDQVCEWESVRHNPPGLPIYYVYYSPHNASLWITTNQIEYFTFCPICGKRIKYVEVE